MDIKSESSIQGRGIRGKNKIRLNTDGRHCFGLHAWKNHM